MKIILTGPSFPFRGGIANFNDSLYNALVNEHDVQIIGFSLLYPAFLFPGKSQYENGSEKAGHVSGRLINSINPLSWFSAAGEIAGKRPECVVIHYWTPFLAPALGTIARLVKRRSDVKVIGLIHNITPHEKTPASPILNKYFLKSCDSFITLSLPVHDELQSLGIQKPVRVIPHPLYDIFGEPVSRQVACRHLDLDEHQYHILFFGMIRQYKGLDLFLKAGASSRLEHLNLKLIVAGEFYEGRDKYSRLVKELGLEKKVIFTDGFVPGSEVPYYFGAADLVVLPYRSATQSGVTKIAFHYDKPVLVTNVGGLDQEIANGVTGYVCSKDPDDIAVSIADYFDNRRSDEFTENIRTVKKRYSWEELARGITELALSD